MGGERYAGLASQLLAGVAHAHDDDPDLLVVIATGDTPKVVLCDRW